VAPPSFANLLYDNIVNIDDVPLEAFVFGVEGQGDGEEIDVEEVFDASQQRNGKRTYTKVEDTCFVMAWESVSLDAVWAMIKPTRVIGNASRTSFAIF
jgi:hypothetical protein